MSGMRISRRTLLGLAASGLAWPLWPIRAAATGRETIYLSARADDAGRFRVSGFTPNGRSVFDLALPERGHSFAVHPTGLTAVHFARRPGRFARVLDLAGARSTGEIAPPDGRHFYGHGVFSPDGGLLYATENDYAGERGVIGVYDARNGYRRVGELPSHGIGPHEIRLLSDGETLVVANGGILTHPDLPRVKLNLPTMSPSLAYVSRRDGRLLEQVTLAPDLHQLSIRHIDVGRRDTVAVAMQYQGPAGDRVPLVGVHRRGEEMVLPNGPADVLRSMNQYCGSTAFDRSGRVFAVSAPRGNLVTFWDAASGALLSTAEVADGCGVAPCPAVGTFLASSGRGGVVVIDAETGTRRMLVSGFLESGRWDNHMMVAGG